MNQNQHESFTSQVGNTYSSSNMCDFECGKTPSKMAARIQNRASPNPLPAQDVDHEQYQGLSGASFQANVKPNFPEPAVGWKL